MAVISFKCPNCDGELIFEPSTQKYKCEYCGSDFTQAQIDGMRPASSEEDGAASYSCPSCGAEIVTNATTAASFCYYCHNPVILSGRLEGRFLPDKVIPFEMTKEAAVKGFLDFVGKKKFVPKAFFHERQIERMTGVYFPYWDYDVELRGKMMGEGRKIRRWRSGNVEYIETKIYSIIREGNIQLEHLTENALQKANAKLAAGVMPYDFSRIKDFNLSYLSGFQAEKRDIERNAVEGEMQGRMKSSAERLMKETVSGYTSVSMGRASFLPGREKFSYCLLPVWTVTYKGRDGKIYYFSMNGQTGKVCGELPVDYKKLSFVSILVFAAIVLLGLIGGYYV